MPPAFVIPRGLILSSVSQERRQIVLLHYIYIVQDKMTSQILAMFVLQISFRVEHGTSTEATKCGLMHVKHDEMQKNKKTKNKKTPIETT